jgi:hypothetical protein
MPEDTAFTIAYFVTSHGFGHAARASAVMEALNRKFNNLRFLVFTTVPEWFFTDSGLEIAYHRLFHDVGLIQSSPFANDLPATLQQLDELIPFNSQMTAQVMQILNNAGVSLILCDISSFGLLLARQMGIASVLIENFTWDWIYQSYIEEYPAFSEINLHLDALYALADIRFQAEPVCQPVANSIKIKDPIARLFKHTRPETRALLGIPDEQHMTLLSLGGIESSFGNLEKLYSFESTVFVVPGGAAVAEHDRNIILLPHHSSYYNPDLIHAADLVVGKAGYSTLAEVMMASVPYAFISRGDFRESEVMLPFIKNNLPSLEIKEQEYTSGNWFDRLSECFNLTANAPHPTNGSDTIVSHLADLINQLR